MGNIFILATIFLFRAVVLSAASSASKVDLPKLNSSDCTCFRTEISNSSSFNFWNYYKFWDFRNISTNEALSTPDILNGELGTANAGLTSDYFNSDAFALDWTVQNWNNSATKDDILMINSQNNLYIERYSHSPSDVNTFVTLRTARQPAFQSAAEIVSKQANFRYLSIRFKARVIGSSGASAGLFTYREKDNVVSKIDFEFLTQGPRNIVHLTNQGSGVETFNYSFPQGSMSDWRVYRMDWDQLSSRWWLGGEQVKLFQRDVPKSPSRLNVNIWSNGGAWSGKMDPYEQAFFQIQWIEVAFNTSGPDEASGLEKRKIIQGVDIQPQPWGTSWQTETYEQWNGPPCKVICSIEERDVEVLGTPKVLYETSAGTHITGRAEVVLLRIVTAVIGVVVSRLNW